MVREQEERGTMQVSVERDSKGAQPRLLKVGRDGWGMSARPHSDNRPPLMPCEISSSETTSILSVLSMICISDL